MSSNQQDSLPGWARLLLGAIMLWCAAQAVYLSGVLSGTAVTNRRVSLNPQRLVLPCFVGIPYIWISCPRVRLAGAGLHAPDTETADRRVGLSRRHNFGDNLLRLAPPGKFSYLLGPPRRTVYPARYPPSAAWNQIECHFLQGDSGR